MLLMAIELTNEQLQDWWMFTLIMSEVHAPGITPSGLPEYPKDIANSVYVNHKKIRINPKVPKEVLKESKRKQGDTL